MVYNTHIHFSDLISFMNYDKVVKLKEFFSYNNKKEARCYYGYRTWWHSMYIYTVNILRYISYSLFAINKKEEEKNNQSFECILMRLSDFCLLNFKTNQNNWENK